MFKVEVNEQSSKTDKLLANIQELLEQLVNNVPNVEAKELVEPIRAIEISVDGLERNELIALAKEVGVKGNVIFIKSTELVKKIKEVQNG